MSFTVRLPMDAVPIEAGATVPCTVEIANTGSEAERFEIQVEGIDLEWTVVPVPEFKSEPGESHSEKVFFKPPRSSESVAGNYPFVVRVRSLVSGEAKTVQGVLQIRPYHYISMEVLPRRTSLSPFHKNAILRATVMNLGNSEHTLQLFGSDPDDACNFEFEQEQVTVSPGQQRVIEVNLAATAPRMLARSKLFNFVLSARSMSSPSVVASAQGQLETRSPVSPTTLIGLIFFIALAGLWIRAIPKTPTIEVFFDPKEPVVGQKVTVMWQAHDATEVKITLNRAPLADTNETSGKCTFTASDPKRIYLVVATPARDGREGESKHLDIAVKEPPPTPNPVLDAVRVKGSSNVKLGDTYTIVYKVRDAARLYLGETGEALDLQVSEHEFKATQAGKQDYTLIAVGQDPAKVVKRKFTINVTDPSTANITSFTADPAQLPAPGAVTLTWQTTGASQVLLSVGGASEKQVDPNQTGLILTVDKSTQFILRALDDQARPVTKKVHIIVKPPEPSPLPTDSKPLIPDQPPSGTP